MKKHLSKIGRKLQNFVFRNRLGKRPWSARFLFYIMSQFDRFEEYSNTGNVSTFDHYIPKFILRRFSISNAGTKKGKIFEYNFNLQLVKESDITTSGGAYGHDAFKDISGLQSDYVSRKVYSENLELRGSKVVAQINNEKNEPSLTFLEESTLAVFLAHQITRVPAFYAALEKFILYLKSRSLLNIKDLENPNFLQDQIVRNEREVSIDDLHNFQPNARISGARNHSGLLTRLIATEIANKIYQGTLHILDIPISSNENFVISDNPVVLLDLERGEVLTFPAWWDINKKDLWIFMPISPKRCIFYSKRIRRGSVVENQNLDMVQLVNFGQYLNASYSVFSNDKNILGNHLKVYGRELNRLRVN